MNFGSKLRSIRKLNNLRQEQMAEALYTTQGNYSQYENNNRVPSIDLLKRLIEKFDLDANWLLFDHNDEMENSNNFSKLNIKPSRTDNYNQLTERLIEVERKVDSLLIVLQNKCN